MIDQLLAGGVIAAGFACDQDVEIADGVASAAQGTGRSYFFHAGILAKMLDNFFRLLFGRVEEKASGDATVVFDGLEQLLLVFLPHTGKLAYFSLAREFGHTLQIAHVIGTPDEGNGLGAEALDLEQVEHGGMILGKQFGVQRKFSFLEHLLQVYQHAFADAGDSQDFFGIIYQVGDLLGLGLDGFGGVAVRTDAEGILPVNFEQVGGFVENAGDCFVVHCDKD